MALATPLLSSPSATPIPDLGVQLPLRALHPPRGEDWLHEPTVEGIRALAWCSGSRTAILRADPGAGLGRSLRGLTRILGALPGSAVLDGHITALRPDGRPSPSGVLEVELRSGDESRLCFWVSDLLNQDGVDLRELPLLERKRRLVELLRGAPARLRVLAHAWNGQAQLKRAWQAGARGIVSRSSTSPYRAGPQRTWLEVGCDHQQALVVVGFTPARDPGTSFGNLLLAARTRWDRPLVLVGRVGTGFSDPERERLRDRLDRIRRPEAPVPAGPTGVNWVEPRIVVDVAFRREPSGRLRPVIFQGLRPDLDPMNVCLEDRPCSE